MEESHIVLRPVFASWAILLVAAGAVALTVLAYRRTTRPIGARMKLALIGLRLLAVATLMTALLRPTMQMTTYTVEKRPLLVLKDVSLSMSKITDAAEGSSRLDAVNAALEANSGRLEALAERYDVMRLSFARELLREGAGGDALGYSAYGRALEEALARTPLGQCDGVVLIGDGSNNVSAPDPVEVAARFAERGIPIYTVGVGEQSAGRTRDVAVVSLDAPRRAFAASSFRVRDRVLLRGCKGLSVKLRLEGPEGRMQFHTVDVAHDEELVPVEFEVSPDRPGEFKLTLRAEDVPDEILGDNNARSSFVRVVRGGLRVAYFDSLRPEAKFVARALSGGKQIVLIRKVLSGTERLTQREADWDRYDVVLIGDVSPACFGGDNLDGLKAAVQEGARGLVFLAGSQSAGGTGFRGTVVQDMLPVLLSRRWQYAAGPTAFVVNAELADHPILALGSDASATLEAWRQVPPLTGVVAGAEPKRAAQVLARDEQGRALLAVHRSGAGRVACVLSDTTFRWFFTEAASQDAHQRFWRQLMLWAGAVEEQPREKFSIDLSKDRIPLGEPLTVQASLVGAAGEPLRDARVAVEVSAPDGEASVLETVFSREAGLFRVQYEPAGAGDYVVRAEAFRGGKSVGTDVAWFQATGLNLELEDPTANLSLLRRLSAATAESGGRYVFYANLYRLLDELAGRGDPLRLATSQWREVWDTWLLFALFTLAASAEWGLRKWKGLV